MKVLMFGWEFPPKIYGGLAVASYGIRIELAGGCGNDFLYAQAHR